MNIIHTKMSERDFLLSKCRWLTKENYNEINTDDGDVNLCRFIERWWLEMSITATEENNPFREIVDEYAAYGMMKFEYMDGVPTTLKAVLFNRWTKYNDRTDVDGFKRFYLDVYIGRTRKPA